MSRDEPHNHGPSPNLSCVRCATERPWVDVVIHPVYGPQVSNWPDEPIPPGRYVKDEDAPRSQARPS